MSISQEKVGAILQHFATLFPLEPTRYAPPGEFLALWHALLKDEDAELFNRACRNLLRTLKRFPFPADVVEEIANLAKSTQT